MTGAVHWPELVWVVGAIITVTLAVSGFACFLLLAAWKKLGAVEDALEKKIAQSEASLENDLRAIDGRLRLLEAQQILSESIRRDYFEFRIEVRGEFRTLRDERRSDMAALHARLNDLLMLPLPATPAGP